MSPYETTIIESLNLEKSLSKFCSISPSEITKEMAECNLHRAERALQRVCNYRDRGLYDIELHKLRRDFCKDIFLSISTRPKSGLELLQFVCLLFEKRNLFFDELIQRGILERMSDK